MKLLKIAAAAAVLCVMLTAFCACGKEYETSIQTGEGAAQSTNTTDVITRSTVAVREGQLKLSYIMGRMGPSMRWSDFSGFDHSTDGNIATFAVADGYGRECTMTVTFDEIGDSLSRAELSYGEVTVNILTEDTMVMREIMVEMEQG